jgi:hypothetical protein
MIHFITPLAAKQSVKDWELTCWLLRQTLGSLENQIDPGFTATICCHDIPSFAAGLDDRFRFIVSPFSPPTSTITSSGQNNGLRDMYLKRDMALYHSGAKPNEFVVLLDGDDLYHKNVVRELTEISPLVKGVVMKEGYELCHRSKRLFHRTDINHRTASSFGLRAELLRLPTSLNEEDLEKTLLHEVYHGNVVEFLETNQYPHAFLDGPRTIYVKNTNLNRSDRLRTSLLQKLKHGLGFYLAGRRVRKQDCADFAIRL